MNEWQENNEPMSLTKVIGIALGLFILICLVLLFV
jgi:hypothetical protein